jgi:hypothetical protein
VSCLVVLAFVRVYGLCVCHSHPKLVRCGTFSCKLIIYPKYDNPHAAAGEKEEGYDVVLFYTGGVYIHTKGVDVFVSTRSYKKSLFLCTSQT